LLNSILISISFLIIIDFTYLKQIVYNLKTMNINKRSFEPSFDSDENYVKKIKTNNSDIIQEQTEEITNLRFD
jgi:hypothetical protein